MFKQFELIYVVGDERDLVGVRTNHRRETVYLYFEPGHPVQHAANESQTRSFIHAARHSTA